jgi:predicted nucleic acid-binding protein
MSQSSPQGLRLGGLELTERVIDSSMLAKFLLKEGGWERVKGILAGRPYTLDLAVEEAANAIWRRVTLMGGVSLEKALAVLGSFINPMGAPTQSSMKNLKLQNALNLVAS